MANNTITATARKSAHRAKATLKLARISTLDDIAGRIQVAKDIFGETVFLIMCVINDRVHLYHRSV